MIESALADRHLDLGCGQHPRNPYQRALLFGLDIAEATSSQSVTILKANLAVERIPFPDDHFASVSAYDFLEHVPRILPTADGQNTRFPFIELMNDVWRVLQPGGFFYAMTPAYPHAAAFQDPTHVNILTARSHEYFTRPALLGRMYGFTSTFDLVRCVRVRPKFGYEPVRPDIRHRLRLLINQHRGDASHLVWEFKAVKNSP